MNKKTTNFIVILAGGGGTRLWPKSRKKEPKQFLKLIGDKTLFQHTVERVAGEIPLGNIYVVSSKDFVKRIKEEEPRIPEENILVEPSPKNTAAAAALAATVIAKRNPDAIVSTLAADHFIEEKARFLKFLRIAQKSAAMGDFLVTLGVHPTSAHIGFGYIHIDGEAFKISGSAIFKVGEFKEKPDYITAHAYYASGEYFWNANINSYKASSLLSAIRKYLPTLAKTLTFLGQENFEKEWERLPSEPIDTAILEKTKNVLMVPASFTWNDVGDWATLYSILKSSPSSNTVIGDSNKYVSIDTHGCLIETSNRLIATIGLKDMIVVDTPDAILICPKNRSQDVKKVVQKLSHKNKQLI